MIQCNYPTTMMGYEMKARDITDEYISLKRQVITNLAFLDISKNKFILDSLEAAGFNLSIVLTASLRLSNSCSSIPRLPGITRTSNTLPVRS
jgi:hypothetical protein